MAMRTTGRRVLAPLLGIAMVAVPAQALIAEGNDEGAALLGAMLLSMLTVPVTFLLFFFAISPKTRPTLRIFAGLPGLMTLLTVYLVLIAGSRLDMVWLPMFHAGLAAVMFWLGGVGQHKEAPAMVLSTNPHDGFPPQGSV
jgi:hypothetical protein